MNLFLIDESLSPNLAVRLRELGYNAKSVREIGLKGSDDKTIIEWIINNKAILITGDLDFGELWYWYYGGEFGVIVFRIKSYKVETQYKVIEFLYKDKVLVNEKIMHSLIIATPTRYRIRIGKD
ncbi:DUF5615 family PIN-like protein [Candidatus Woesearchaeota archaeon]|nr:DUF5615 family PIN-like protein [Candidatus Woesearchaeota archaeon]